MQIDSVQRRRISLFNGVKVTIGHYPELSFRLSCHFAQDDQFFNADPTFSISHWFADLFQFSGQEDLLNRKFQKSIKDYDLQEWIMSLYMSLYRSIPYRIIHGLLWATASCIIYIVYGHVMIIGRRISADSRSTFWDSDLDMLLSENHRISESDIRY